MAQAPPASCLAASTWEACLQEQPASCPTGWAPPANKQQQQHPERSEKGCRTLPSARGFAGLRQPCQHCLQQLPALTSCATPRSYWQVACCSHCCLLNGALMRWWKLSCHSHHLRDPNGSFKRTPSCSWSTHRWPPLLCDRAASSGCRPSCHGAVALLVARLVWGLHAALPVAPVAAPATWQGTLPAGNTLLNSSAETPGKKQEQHTEHTVNGRPKNTYRFNPNPATQQFCHCMMVHDSRYVH